MVMGCALTDSPAAIGTERLQFNRALPGIISLTADKSGIAAAALEAADDADKATQEAANEAKGFFAKLTEMLGGGAPAAPTPPAPQTPPASPGTFDMAAFAAEFGKVGTVFEKMLETQAKAFSGELATVTASVTALQQQIENTADPRHLSRPPSTGGNGQQYRAEF